MAVKTPLFGLRNPFKFGLRGVGPSLPITPVLSDFGSGSIDDLELDPPAIFIEHNTSGTLTGDFHSSATPPAKGAGDIGAFTVELSGDAVTDISTALNTFLDLHPGETGYLHFRLTNAAGDSNVITTQEITTPSNFVPTDLGAKLEIWISAEDLTTLWTSDGARTTNVSADGQSVYLVDDKSGDARHFEDIVAAPVYKTSAGKHWLQFSGGASIETEPASWTAFSNNTNMACWVRLRTSDTVFVLAESSASRFFYVAESGSSSTAISSNVGTPTFDVNGVSAGTTRDNLHDAVSTGSWVTVVSKALNLSNGLWIQDFNIGNFNRDGTFSFEGDIAEFILTTNDLTAQEEIDLRAWLATRGG